MPNIDRCMDYSAIDVSVDTDPIFFSISDKIFSILSWDSGDGFTPSRILVFLDILLALSNTVSIICLSVVLFTFCKVRVSGSLLPKLNFRWPKSRFRNPVVPIGVAFLAVGGAAVAAVYLGFKAVAANSSFVRIFKFWFTLISISILFISSYCLHRSSFYKLWPWHILKNSSGSLSSTWNWR